MTSESPTELVEKYGAYGHGEPTGDHRVVLDSTLLPDIARASNIRVFQRAQLLEDFLRTFKDECAIAAALHQPVLLMVFGHGDPRTYGVAIGGAGIPQEAPRLRIRQILACLRGINESLTMLLTSCYSGGWVLQPELNISALTAAGPETVSESWKPSISGRLHGSIYASAVRLAFTKMEDEKATQIHPNPSGVDFNDERLSSTYAELTNVIHKTLLYDVDRLGDRHNIQFAAQDDEWEFEWRKRSGIPLATFQSRWNQLPALAAQEGHIRAPGQIGGLSMGALSLSESEVTDIQGPHGLHRKLNKDQSISAIKDMATGYLNSFPGANNAADNNICHSSARSLLAGKKIRTWELEALQGALKYRIDTAKLASEYKDLLGLAFTDCETFNVESWQDTAVIEYQASQAANTKWNAFKNYRSMISNAGIFDPPVSKAGWEYRKPHEYLAIVCVELGLNTAGVKNAIDTMLAGKLAEANLDFDRLQS